MSNYDTRRLKRVNSRDMIPQRFSHQTFYGNNQNQIRDTSSLVLAADTHRNPRFAIRTPTKNASRAEGDGEPVLESNVGAKQWLDTPIGADVTSDDSSSCVDDEMKSEMSFVSEAKSNHSFSIRPPYFNGSGIEYWYKPRFDNSGYDLEIICGDSTASKLNNGVRTNAGVKPVTAKEIYHVFYTYLSDDLSFRSLQFLRFYFPNGTPFRFGENWRKYPSKKRQVRSLLTHFMAHFGWRDGLKWCTEQLGIPINVGSRHGSLITHTAAFYGHADVLDYALSRGIDVNAENQHGETCAKAALNSWRQFEQQWLGFMRQINDKNNVVYPHMLGDAGDPLQITSLSIGTSISIWHPSHPNLLHLPSAKGDSFRFTPVATSDSNSSGETYYQITLANECLEKPLYRGANSQLALTINRNRQTVSLQQPIFSGNGEVDASQLWRIEVVSVPEYDFGLSAQRMGPRYNQKPKEKHSSSDISIIGKYVRFVPVSMPDYEMYANREPLPSTVNDIRFANRIGELRIRPQRQLCPNPSDVSGLFQMVKEAKGSVNHFRKGGNILEVYQTYARVIEIIAHYMKLSKQQKY